MSDRLANWFVSLGVPGIEAIDLADGVVKLRLRDRPASGGPGDAAPSGRPREPARIITMCWGDRYVADLLAVTIPAVLAPGNIPAFAEEFDSEFVIVTERRLFEQIANAPVTQQLLKYCDLRLVPVDDLLSPWYGITLTYALVRGFVDLGETMTRTHLVFLNADFIVADGSYRKLAEVIRRGERLVVSPSYCMVLEETLERLRSHYDTKNQTLTISRRDMAAMIIAHRHNTIRAKTVNQRLFRIHRYDQFYWYVDDRTLLSRQMPIAVVYMRPEHALTQMATFWDYGVISEYCPTIAPCVLGDSDDFLMGELRTASTFAELLHLGWPSISEIVADLSSFTTKDHRDYGRHVLTLHAGELPKHIDGERAKFRAFIDDVDTRLKPPIDYLNHPFWAKDFPRFSAMIAEGREKLQAELRAVRALQSSPASLTRLRDLLQDMGQVLAQRHAIETGRTSRESEVRTNLQALELRYQNERNELERGLQRVSKDGEAALQKLSATYQDLRKQLEQLLLEAHRSVADTRGDPGEAKIESPGPGSPSAVAELTQIASSHGPAQGTSRAFPPPARRPAARQARLGRWAGMFTPLYHRFFGPLPHTTQWHPCDAMLRPAVRAIISVQARVSNVLVVTSEGPIGPLLVKPLAARKVTVIPDMIQMDSYRELMKSGGNFDLCVCDLSLNDLRRVRPLLERIRKGMAPDGKIVVFHKNLAGNDLDKLTYDLTSNCFPLFGRSRATFAGSLLTSIAARWFFGAVYRHSVFRLGGFVAFTAVLTAAAPLARFGGWLEQRRAREGLPKHWSSLTIEVDLVP